MSLALLPADHLLIERDRGQFVPSRRRRMMANVRVERLLKIPAEPSPELLIPCAAAQTRVVSMAGIRLGSWESARARLVLKQKRAWNRGQRQRGYDDDGAGDADGASPKRHELAAISFVQKMLRRRQSQQHHC